MSRVWPVMNPSFAYLTDTILCFFSTGQQHRLKRRLQRPEDHQPELHG